MATSTTNATPSLKGSTRPVSPIDILNQQSKARILALQTTVTNLKASIAKTKAAFIAKAAAAAAAKVAGK